MKINNEFDFNIVSSKYINKIKIKDYNFIFGTKEIKDLKSDIYLITDEAYLFANSSN